MNHGSSLAHRCDEFPAEYSLVSCSPAELASASSAMLMLQPTTSFAEQNSANGNPGNSLAVSLKGSIQGIKFVRTANLKLVCFQRSKRLSWRLEKTQLTTLLHPANRNLSAQFFER
jgi:hypothetical protein